MKDLDEVEKQQEELMRLIEEQMKIMHSISSANMFVCWWDHTFVHKFRNAQELVEMYLEVAINLTRNL